MVVLTFDAHSTPHSPVGARLPGDQDVALAAEMPAGGGPEASGSSGHLQPVPPPRPILLAQAEGGAPAGSPEARYEAAFEAMMQDLSDPERSFDFAEAAVEVGDVRGAIAALERILLLNPNLPNIALELGVLYQRVGNNALAAQYLDQALTAEGVPESVRQRAEDMLAVAEAATTRHQFHGSLFAGVRFDTNPDAAPDEVRFRGEDQRPDDSDKEDFSGLASVSLQYQYILPNQAEDTIETNLLLFGQRFSRDANKDLDTELFDLDLGPRLHIGPIESSWLSIRPFGRAGHIRLDDDGYLWRYGGGLEAEKTITPRLYADGSVGVFYQDFDDTKAEPTASERTGIQIDVDAGLAYLLLPTTTLSGRVDYARRDAHEGYEAFNAIGVGLAVIQRYPGLFELVDEPWSVTLSGDVEYTFYDDEDPQVDKNKKQEDWRFDVGLTNAIPLTSTISLTTSGRYTNVQSTLPNDDYDNFSVTVGVGWRF